MRILRQIGLIMAICLICEGVSAILPFPFPGSVLAMLLLLLLFCLKVIRLEQIRGASDFLLGHMMLVFLPSVVGLINYLDVLSNIWVQLLVIVVVSTLVTFLVAGTVVTLVIRLQSGGDKGKEI